MVVGGWCCDGTAVCKCLVAEWWVLGVASYRVWVFVGVAIMRLVVGVMWPVNIVVLHMAVAGGSRR